MSETPRWGMVIDLKKCVSCHACAVACKVHNGIPLGQYINRVLNTGLKGYYPNLSHWGLPRACMQCENPPCVKVCPTKATTSTADGVVTIDQTKCVGCRYCMAACPYGARNFNEELGVVQKCDFCLGRRQQGRQPICVQTCVGGARYFGDLNDPGSEINKVILQRNGAVLLPELGTQPAVFYCGP